MSKKTVWALERIPILARHSLQLRILRYRRYSAFLPLTCKIYACALKTADATAEIKVSPEESRISVIRKALNAREIEKNTTDFFMKRIKSLEKEVKRVRSLEEEVQFLKKGYAELKQSKNENIAFFGSRKEDEHTNMSKEKVPKGSSINNRTTPLTESVREHREEVPNSEPKVSSRNYESKSMKQGTGEFSRQRRERKGNNAKVDDDVINLASDAAEVPIDYSTTPIADEFGNDSTRSVNMDLLKSFEWIGKRVPKKSSWLRTPYQAYDNRRANKKQLNPKEQVGYENHTAKLELSPEQSYLVEKYRGDMNDNLLINPHGVNSTKASHYQKGQVLPLSELKTLRSPAWLSGAVIDAYLFLLKIREEKYKDKFLECHFFPT